MSKFKGINQIFDIKTEQVLCQVDEWVFYTDGRGVKIRKEEIDAPRFISLGDAIDYAMLIEEMEESANKHIKGFEERMDAILSRTLS